jgi:hypothetical protein
MGKGSILWSRVGAWQAPRILGSALVAVRGDCSGVRGWQEGKKGDPMR